MWERGFGGGVCDETTEVVKLVKEIDIGYHLET